MAWNLVQEDDGGARLEASTGASQLNPMTVKFADGVEVELGRGETDTDITYIGLYDAAGTLYYVYIDTGAVTASTTKP